MMPGSEKVANVQEAMEISRAIGFPLVLKAAAREARAAFGDDTLYKVSLYMRQMSAQRLGGKRTYAGSRTCSQPHPRGCTSRYEFEETANEQR